MALQTSGQVVKGTVASVGAGSTGVPFGQDQFTAGYVSELNARYGSLTLAGVVFGVQFAQGAAAAASATAAGAFVLYNPVNSGKNLVLLESVVTLATGSVQTTNYDYGIATWTNQNPTAVTPGNTPQCTLVGSGNTAVAKTATVATIVGGSTVPIRQIASFQNGATAAFGSASVKDEIAGAVVVAPGSGIDLVAITAAGTAAQVLSYTWAELPV